MNEYSMYFDYFPHAFNVAMIHDLERIIRGEKLENC